MVHARNFGKVFFSSAVFLHILSSGVSEELCRTRLFRLDSAGRVHHHEGFVHGGDTVVEEGLEGAGEHLFEADDEDDFCGVVGEELACHVEAC